MKRTRKALLSSIIALVLCFSMLLGTTWAWFTDEVTSGGNIIQSGTLKAEMFWSDNGAEGTFADASQGAIFNYQHWEPGFTQIKYVKVENTGNLAFRYMLNIIPSTLPVAGEANLADVIDVYFAMNPQGAITRENVSTTMQRAGTLSQLMATAGGAVNGVLLPTSGSAKYDDILAKEANAQAGNTTYCIALKMQEAAGNEYQNKTVNGSFAVQLLASQYTYENDSFGNDYDQNAVADFFPGFQDGTAGIAVAADEQGKTADEVTMAGGDVSAVIPAGVLLADGATSLELAVTVKATSEANIQLGANEEMRSLDVHIEGVAQDNTVPMLITLKQYLATGINTGALKLYHVENGASVAMTQVANPENHNEFSYDPLTGDVTLALKSFSEVAVVADTNNPWDGTAATAFGGGNGTEANPYQIANADQLAYFRNEVDGGRSFVGEYVKLNNNIYLSNVNFDPIGWGYVNKEHNRNGDEGKVFMGTFDGDGHTIFDLYQNGWDLEADNGTDYTYTNCGFGLFAAASNATFKNLVISGADIKAECVEMGVLVGLSQNNCTYDKIKIYNSKIANYQRPAGGLIGEVSGEGATTITNVTIGSDVVVGSLWGDFDAPCGGVIGARWDDIDKNPQIVMKYVDVGCRLDVYNDVTSAYQWHAYRRAGMLIGNTDTPAANGKIAQVATADFLKCPTDEDGKETVIVHLGSWADYNYCQFTNTENPGRNYPWVRVEAGENNSAYSNPRYGHPVDANGNIVDGESKHKHAEGDICNMTISFAQLYGGGQGVYGATTHEGVKLEGYRYSIIYVNNDEVLSIQYVTEEMAKKTDPFIPNDDIALTAAKAWVEAQGYNNVVFDCWVTAGSKKAEIPATNTENITVYPAFTTPYTARFVDLDGNVLDWCFFNEAQSNITTTRENAQNLLPKYNDVKFDKWEVHIYEDGSVKVEDFDLSKFSGKNCYKTDVTIYPVYTYDGNLNLVPVDSDGDGKTDYYKVVATAELDETTTIPGNVLGIPVKVVEKLYKNDDNFDYGSGVTTIKIEEGVEELKHNSLAYTKELDTVYLPSTLKKMEKNTFSRNNILGEIWGSSDRKQLVIEYNGTKADWDIVVANSNGDWDGGLKSGSVVNCINGQYKYNGSRWTWTANP